MNGADNGGGGGGSSVLAVPRLRLARRASIASSQGETTPVAGPSRLPAHSYVGAPRLYIPSLSGDGNSSDADSQQSTPRVTLLPTRSLLQDQSAPTFAPSSPEDTAPSTRLRALLARTRSSVGEGGHGGRGTTPSEATPRARVGPSFATSHSPPSDFESDFQPDSMSVAHSMRNETLRELFSRIRDDTPDRQRTLSHNDVDPDRTTRRRRNSFDTSETELILPKERRTKRKSLSDDELHSVLIMLLLCEFELIKSTSVWQNHRSLCPDLP
jgi:hypothetical protein